MASFGFGTAADNQVPIDSSTPWMAASEGNLSLMELSLKTLNLPLNSADENGYTLLHAAASYSQLKVMEFLLSSAPNNGVNVYAADNDGDSALHYASTVAAAKFLVEHGKANPLQTNGQGKTPLEARKEELQEMEEDEDVEEDDDDLEALKEVVQYLSSL